MVSLAISLGKIRAAYLTISWTTLKLATFFLTTVGGIDLSYICSAS